MNSSKRFLIVAVLALFSVAFAEARGVSDYDVTAFSYYVAASGNDANNGLSEQSAFKTFAKAVGLASSSHVRRITIIGVLDNETEASLNDGSVFTIANSGSAEIIISGKSGSAAELRGGKGRRVMSVLGNSRIRFEDIRITGGDTESQGGGIFSQGGSEIILAQGTVLTNNLSSQGGAIYIEGGSLMLLGDATVIDNMVSTDEGGGVVVASGTFLMTDDSQISGNSGGGLILLESEGVMKGDSAIAYNNCKHFGGGVFIYTGNFFMSDNSQISGNKAGEDGGGIWIGYGSLMLGGNASINRNEATGNGGGISMENASLTAQGYSEIITNKGGHDGGGIHTQGGYLILDEYTRLSDNEAPCGGGFCINNLSSAVIRGNVEVAGNLALGPQGGGGLCAGYSSSIHMTGGEVKNNVSTRGGGVYLEEATLILDAGYIMYNWAELGGGIYTVEDSFLKINTDGALVEDNNPDNIKEQVLPKEPGF